MYWGVVNLIPAPQNPRVVPHATLEILYRGLGPRRLSGKSAFAEENDSQPRAVIDKTAI